MDFADQIATLAQRVVKLRDSIQTEEACKNAFVMPFLKALGYDVFNPEIVIPEFTADVGTKKGEKVDYAIRVGDKISILIECKGCGAELSTKHTSQLYRYFSVTEARFSILTNGIVYWFYSDLEQPNKMDAKPFFEFDLLDYRPTQLDELKKFGIANFDVDSILATASDLKYSSAIRRELMKELEDPSDEVCRLFVGRVYDGKLMPTVMAKFSPLVGKAFRETVRELVNQRLSSAMDEGQPTAISPVSSGAEATDDDTVGGIVTTPEEIEGYQIVRAIVREVVKADRVVMRDAKSYCAILLDDNNRKPIARLHFNRSVWYLGLFNSDRSEERVKIESVDDIFLYSDRLKETVRNYDAVPA